MKDEKKKILSDKDLYYLSSTCVRILNFEQGYYYVKELIKVKNGKLNEDEKLLYFKALKGKYEIYKKQWQTLIDYYNFEDEKVNISEDLTENKRKELEKIMKDFCLSIISETNNILKKTDKSDIRSEIFYSLVKADYYRYLGDFLEEDEYKSYALECHKIYDRAYELCQDNLDSSDFLFLTVSLHYSVFLYSNMEDIKSAFDICNNAYRQAIQNITNDMKNPEIEMVIKAIQENLTIWKIELTASQNN